MLPNRSDSRRHRKNDISPHGHVHSCALAANIIITSQSVALSKYSMNSVNSFLSFFGTILKFFGTNFNFLSSELNFSGAKLIFAALN